MKTAVLIGSRKPDGTTLANNLHFKSSSPEETFRLGRAIGAMAEPGDVILLSGPLGAGKTCLAQGIAKGIGVEESPSSPSYVLVREFKGRMPFYHMDLYRLEFEEIAELGIEDYLSGKGVCVIEWAEKAGPLMPKERLSVNLSYRGELERGLEVIPEGGRYELISQRISEVIGSLPKDNT